ncbi:hypothetical protein [Streptomyces orinoci]|uniref:Uncharacterized protein n=1 Tax=Streptomyces orinoci TaxID=67339 RepID=A0ABV3K7G8_STRON|nr:hypothetical protein [Streptomyces orinoci]
MGEVIPATAGVLTVSEPSRTPVAACRRTNLTLRRLAPLFAIVAGAHPGTGPAMPHRHAMPGIARRHNVALTG